MRRVIKIVLIFSLLLPVTITSTAKADDSAPSIAVLPSHDETIFQKFYRDLYSPFVNPTTLTIFAGGAASTLTLLATHTDFEDKWLEETAKNRPLKHTAVIGDYAGQMLPNILYVGVTGVSYLFTKDPLTQMRMELMFRATLAATTTSTILKATIREPRPTDDNELTSFPSGHSTSIFAFATVIAAMHGPYWGAGAYTLAAFTAFSRMNDNRHRLHDVVAGATLGSMYGLSVYRRMRDAKVPSIRTVDHSFQYEIAPVVVNDGAMLNFSATF